MPISPVSQLAAIQAHHIRGLPPERQLILVLRAASYAVETIAHLTTRSVGAIKRETAAAENAIFDPLGIHRSSWAAGTWSASHLLCCLRQGEGLASELVAAAG